MTLAANLARIRQQIAEACHRAHRPEAEVALMAVSKTHSAEAVMEAYAAGVRLFGENRVQEWQEKRPALEHLFNAARSESSAYRRCGPSEIARSDSPSAQDSAQDPAAQMHLIGPLQSNKTARAVELFHAIDAVDSLKIATRLDTAARALGKRMPILIEVKLSHEESKHGIAPAELPALVAGLTPLENLIPAGLMTVPPWADDPERARPCFRELRRLRDASLAACPTLTQLSMGMSHDFGVAIEEGSTCIRIGTALFGDRQVPAGALSSG
jgi:pyridoxal phosphate enzyme (YggS family)